MTKRERIIASFYERADEETRLQRSRHGQLEYHTTMAMIRRYANPASKVLELGAGTGKYSTALARSGMDVTVVELADSNYAVLKKNSAGLENIHVFQGDATDLGNLPDSAFDLTLSLGPMYHLYEKARSTEQSMKLFGSPRSAGSSCSRFCPCTGSCSQTICAGTGHTDRTRISRRTER